MSTEQNVTLVQRFLEEVFNHSNLDAIASFFVPGSMIAGGIEGQYRTMKAAFPDMQATIENIFAGGNHVAVRVTNDGTNTGPIVGLPGIGRLETPLSPTGKPITVSGIMLFTIADGKIKSISSELDTLGLLRQLGWTMTPPATT